MIGLHVAQLFKRSAAGTLERVLWIDDFGRGLYAIDVESSSALPVFHRANVIVDGLGDGTIEVVTEDPWLQPISEDAIPPIQRARRDEAWALIKPLVMDQPAIFQENTRGKAVQRVIAECDATKPRLYRLLRRYWQRGCCPNALLPDFHRCGGRGKVKAAGRAKRGRAASIGAPGVNVTPEMRALIREWATKSFARNRKMDFAESYHQFVDAHFSDRVIDERTGRQILVTRGDEVLSPRQFRYWFAKEVDTFKIERIRRTPRIYDKDSRALIGSSTTETLGPGSRFQIDATIADVYLVSRYDRTKIVGRPVLYIVIDVFSRMITGVYVGFEGPSWVGAMMAISNGLMPKPEYCRQFGIDIAPADWLCEHLPDAILGDRGEMVATPAETLANAFSVRVENTAPFRADWKGIVEQRLKLIPSRFKPYVEGYIEGDFQARGGKDYRLDAVLDIDEFTRMILLCILYYNNDHEIEDYPRTREMIADKVRPVPIDLWEWGVAKRSGKLRQWPPAEVQKSLLPTTDATVTVNGIQYAGCFYSCRKALEEHWFETARKRGVWKVRISYEPRCMDYIYVHDASERGKLILCDLTDRSRVHQGRTLWEILQINKEDRREHARHQPRQRQARINLADGLKDVVEGAKAKRDGAPSSDLSAKARVSNIRENRREERRARQDQEAFRPSREERGGEVVRFPTAQAEEDYRLPDITEILRSVAGEGADDDSGS